MKKMWKRFVSLLLACTLLAGMLPLSASAAGKPGEGSEQYKYAESILNKLNESITNEQEKYGLYGPALLADSELYTYSLQRSIYDEDSGKWTTDTQYILVPGVDAQNTTTPNYNGLNSGQPWAESNPSAIYIAEGVTGIGNYAFASQPSLNNVVFQDASDLTYIGQRAFYDDDNAVFTDEGNGDGTTLDLSNVNKMGEYAFYNCDKLTGVKLGGSIMAVETVEGKTEKIENKIPNNAFNNSGLQTVTIPDGIVHIGDGAFGHTSLSAVGELVLPSGLQTIGDNAFVATMGEGNTSSGITSLTIPSTVTSIGTDAFSGRRNLQTVTVEDDGKEGAQLTLGHGAFGTNEFTAYSEQGSITDAAGTTYHGLLGTTFYLPADLVTTFRNGENCFTGDISPMEYVDTVEPTCTTNGYHIYRTTISGAISGEGQPVVVTYHVPLQMLGHDYQFSEKIPATCETDSYDLYVCSHDSSHTENRNVGNESGPKGHNYLLTDVENLDMGDGSATTFTWTCQKQEHDDSRDTRKKEVKISINPTAVQADTTMTYGELVMPTVTSGTLALASSVDEDKELTTEVQSVPVVFTPDSVTYAGYTGMGAVSGFGGVELTLKVDVNKAELDFSDVNFGNTRVFVNSTASEGTPITVYRGSLPEDVTDGPPLYSNDTGYNKNTPPPRNSTWSGTVSVTFTYDPNKYEVDTEKKPGANYTFDTSEEGQVTITHPYVIVEQSMNDLAAAPIRSLTYKANTPQDTVHLSGVPYSSTVSWEWEEVGNPSNSGGGTEISPSDENAMDIAPITDAGTYRVTITVEKDGFTSKTLAPITVTIAKAPVMTPTAVPDLQYKGVEQRGLQEPAPDALYTYVGGSQLTGTNAGPYTATAQLKDSENYRWSTGDSDGDGTVEISWNIAKRRVIETSINSVYKDQTTPFTGTPITAVSPPSSTSSGFFDVEYDDEGNLVGKIKGTETVAFKISHAQETNAETYTVIASIEDFANFCWQNHPYDEDVTLGTWTIGKLQINAPTITAEGATYTGGAYAGKVTLVHSDSSEGIIDLEKTKPNIRYYTQRTGGNGGDAPVNAGTYFAGVENWVFEKDKIPGNYTILGGQRGAFTISKAPLTLTAPIENLSVTYTGSDQTVPPPTVEGLQGDDTASDYSLVYTYTIGESEVTQNQTGELKLSQVGTYNISVSVSQECTNYTSNTVKYDFTISTANQTVKLTQEGGTEVADGGSISKTLGDVPFTVTGKGYVNDVVVNEDDIGYEVTGGDTQNPVVEVDPTRGEVTLLRAGRATITVTAEGSANYQAATASYTITVDKGTPTVEVQMPESGSADNTYSYTGEALTFSATVTGAGNGAVAPTTDERVTYNFYSDNSGQKGDKIDSQPTKIGTYWVEAVYEGDDNYNPKTSEPVQFTISPAALEVEANGYTGIYNGQPHDPVESIQVTGVDGVISPEKYTISYAKKTSDQPPEADGNWSSTLQVKDVAHSGDYWIKVVIDGDDSSYAPYVGKDPITVTINPRPLKIERKVTARKPYDGKKEATVEFKTINTGVDGETVKVTDTRAEYNSPNVEHADTITITYKLTAEDGTNLANYSLDGEAVTGAEMGETVTEGVGITPASITVAINDQTSVYDGEEPDVAQGQGTSDGDTKNWYVSEGTIYNSDNLGITLSIDSDSDAKDAGAYAIIGKWTNSNYTVTFTGSWKGEDANNGEAGIYTITPRPISVQIGNAEGFYGDVPDLTLGTKVILTPETAQGEEAGLVNGENIYGALEGLSLGSNATVSSSVGENYIIYPLNDKEPVLDDNGTFGNYNVTFTNEGTYTVKPRPITITIEDHSSVYGEKIDGGIADPDSGEDYTVAITEGNTVTGGAIVNKDDLGIALSTTANKDSNAGTYPISGEAKAEPSVVSNYAITWAGETPWSGSGQGSTVADPAKGTYTIDKAQLKVSVSKSDIYAQYGEEISNPVTFTNESTGQAIALDASDYTALSQAITYEMNPSDGLTQVEGSENAEGKFTVAVTQQMVTVTVNVAATENYEAATEITYHIHASASGSLDVSLPFADLTYNGQPQQLLAQAPELPDDVYIRYKVGEKGTWTKYSDEAPNNWQSLVGTGAGDYTVYWETKAGGNYNASSGHETTEIKKADLSATYKGLNDSEVILVLSEMRDTYTIPLDLTGNEGYTHSNGDGVTFLSGNTDVAIAKNSTATLELRGVAGEAKITINCPGDNNYNPGTFTFTVKVTDQKAEIKYNVTGATTTYNGQPQTIAVNVTAPASGATVMYWNEEAKAYDLSEPPAYTDVKDSGTTIKFQITAPGYETVTGEATLKIEPKKITETIIAGIAESYTYTGKEITFDDAISVHDEGVLLKQNTDYTVSYDQNTAVGIGSVTITGTGNYKESVTKNFTISPVDASDLTASLDRTFGYYGDSETNNATVTVTHGGHTVDSREIALTVTRQDSTIESGDVVKEGLKLTFNKAGIYTIHVVVAGTHTGTFDLTYTLLPQDVASDDFQVTTNPVGRVWTYDGENRAFGVTVTSGGTSLQKDVDFTLRYTYLPYVGSQEENEYDPESTEFTEAGIYTVIVKGTGNYTGHAELVALIQPRDLSDAGIAAAFAQTGLVYNGEAQEPEVALTYNGTAITQLKDTEYYGNTNAGEAQALSAASEDCNNFTGARVDAFTIEKKSLNDSTITAKADPEKYYYTGYPVTPAVTVTDSGRNVGLSIGADYTVSSDAVGPGKVTATVTGTGNYKDTVTVEFTILPTGAEPVETLNLTVTPSEWTWDNGQTKAAISVTFNGTELNDTDYQLTVSKDGETPKTVTKAEAVELLSAPGKYTITATGVGAYNGSTDTETVTIQKIQPEVTVTATPNSLSGGGKVTLTLKGEKLPAFAEGQDLSSLLTASAKDEKNAPDLSELEWETDEQTGVMTAELTLPNTSETYTFTLTFTGNEYYEAATASEQVVVAQQIISGGGGGPVEDQPANPDDTGVSDWLNTKEHLAYLAGYPGGIFGPDQNMTRAEAAQMFYNLLLEKDVEITVEFVDVPEDAWYATPVNTLASLGILSGVGNGRFDPERSITRAEFTVIAMKFANTSGGGVNIFSDVNEDDWFYSAVVDSTQYGWINGYPDGTFRPEATISRAEVTVIVNHMLGRAADRPYVIAHEEELNTFGDVNRGHWGYFHIAEATNAHEYHTEDGTESWTGLS